MKKLLGILVLGLLAGGSVSSYESNKFSLDHFFKSKQK